MPAILRVAVPVPLLQVFDYLPPRRDRRCARSRRAAALPCRSAAPARRRRRRGRRGIGAGRQRASEAGAGALLDPQPLLTAELLDTRAPGQRATTSTRSAKSCRPRCRPACAARAKPQHAGERGSGSDSRSRTRRKPPRAGSRAAQLLDLLARGPLTAPRLDVLLPGWRSAAANLKRRGLIATITLTRTRIAARADRRAAADAEQQRCDRRRLPNAARQLPPILLEGITGSGKTEVYLAADRTGDRARRAGAGAGAGDRSDAAGPAAFPRTPAGHASRCCTRA